MKSMRSRLGPLQDANFQRFYLGYTTSLLGSGMAPVGTAFAVLASGGDASDLGYILTSCVIATIACLVVGGVVADRLGRRSVMLWSDTLRFAAQGAFAGLVLAGHPPLGALIGLSAAVGVGTGFFSPALTALTRDIVAAEQLQDANVLIGLAKNVGTVCGPALAGALVALTSAGSVVAIDAATYAVSVVSLSLLRFAPASSRVPSSMLSDLRNGWTAWRSRSWVWVMDVKFALFNAVVYAPLLVLGPAIAQHRLGGAAPWGLILTAQGVGAVIASLVLIGRRPHRPLVVVVLVHVAWALPLAGLALVLPLLALAAMALFAGAGSAISLAIWTTALQRNVPANLLARVSSYDYLASFAVGPLGLAAAGPVAGFIGSSTLLWIGAGWQILSTMVIILLPQIHSFYEPCAVPELMYSR